MDFDDILEELGELGKFQIVIYLLICLPVLFAAANSLSYVFTAGIPNYRCFIPECEDVTATFYDTPWLNWAIPPNDADGEILDTKISSCDRYNSNASLINGTCFKEIFTNEVITCKEWVFDHSERTVVSDWNMTCIENQWKLSFVGTTHFAGIVVGSGLFGYLADKYGRKRIFIFCIMLMSISGIVQAVSPEYITFDAMMFINAMGTAGVYPLAFILGVEMVGKRKREITGIVLNYFYAVGEALVGLIAWYTRDWVVLQLTVSAPALLFVGYLWIVPESVRWLFANQKRDKAKGIVYKAAKFNNVTLSESIKDSFKENTPLTDGNGGDHDRIWPIIKLLLKSRIMTVRFLIIYFIWAVNAFVFYGLSVNSTSLGGNKYLNFSLVSLIEIPGYTLAWICIQKLGRRISLVASLLLCGLTCASTIFVPSETTWAVILLFLIGKLAVTSAFGIVYVYTAEMLPTIVRSGGVGSASTVARIGALLAPFVPMLSIVFTPLPMLLFGCVAISAGLLALKLPETLGSKLPETVKEAEDLK